MEVKYERSSQDQVRQLRGKPERGFPSSSTVRRDGNLASSIGRKSKLLCDKSKEVKLVKLLQYSLSWGNFANPSPLSVSMITPVPSEESNKSNRLILLRAFENLAFRPFGALVDQYNAECW